MIKNTGNDKKYLCICPSIEVTLHNSRTDFADDFFPLMAPEVQMAFVAIAALASRAIANPDENRMVGHW